MSSPPDTPSKPGGTSLLTPKAKAPRKGAATPKTPRTKKSKAPQEEKDDQTLVEEWNAAYQAKLPALEKSRDNRFNALLNTGKSENAAAFSLTHGVHAVDMNIEKPTHAKTAGYLNMYNVKMLELLQNRAVTIWNKYHQIVNKYVVDRVVSKNNSRLSTKLLIEALEDGKLLAADIQEPIEAVFPLSQYPIGNGAFLGITLLQARFVYHTLLAAEALQKECPASHPIFSGPSDPDKPRPLSPLGWDAEDVHRATIFHSWMSRNLNRPDTEKRQGINNADPDLPNFQYSDPSQQITEAQRSLQTSAIKTIMAQEAQEVGFTGDELFYAMQGVKDVAAEDVNRAVDAFLEGKKVVMSSNLPPMDPEVRKQSIRIYGSKVEILFDDPARQNTFFQEVNREAAAKEFDATLEQMRLLRAEGAAQDPPVRYKVYDVTPAQKRLWIGQDSMNQATAYAPTVQDSAKAIGLISKDNTAEIDPISGDYFSLRYHGLPLKPWQGPGAAWLVEKCESQMKGGILADDPGLGKTVQVFIAICELAQKQQGHINDWKEGFQNALICVDVGDAVDHQEIEFERQVSSTQYAVTDRLWELLHNHPVVWESLSTDLDALGPRPIHRPTIIDCPPNALSAWLTDWEKFFSNEDEPVRFLNMKTYYDGARKRESERTRNMVIPKGASALARWAKALDIDDIATSRTVVLTTFQSLQNQVLDTKVRHKRVDPDSGDDMDVDKPDNPDQVDVDGHAGANVTAESPEKEGQQDTDDQDDDEAYPDGPDEEDTDERVGAALRALINPSMWGIRVVDEAHRIKDPNTQQTAAIFLWKDCKTILVTATPAKNRIGELYGLLRFFWEPLGGDLESDAIAIDDYPRLATALEQQYKNRTAAIPRESFAQFLPALNPRQFRELLGTGTKAPSADVAQKVVPLVMQLTTLRRTKGSVIRFGKRIIIVGADIPGMRFKSVEVRMNRIEYQDYLKTVESVKANQEDVNSEMVLEDGITLPVGSRRLALAAFSPALDMFATRKLAANASFVHNQAKQGMSAFNTFHLSTKLDLHVQPPTDRIAMFQFLIGKSPKLRALSGFILEHWLERGEKMIIWAHHPITLWVTELMLEILSIKFVSISARVGNRQRITAEKSFNKDPTVGILVASSLAAPDSMNLQEGGHIQIIMDPVSATIIIQVAGRQNRIGQAKEVLVYLLQCDGTYDQVLTALYQARYRDTVASSTRPSERMLAQLRASRTVDDTLRAEAKLTDVGRGELLESYELTSGVVGAFADATIREQFGMRDNRYSEWSNPIDFFKKDLLPEERLYRLGYGGAPAREIINLWSMKKQAAKAVKKKKRLQLDPDDPLYVPVLKVGNAASGLPDVPVPPTPPFTLAAGYEFATEALKELSERPEFQRLRIGPTEILGRYMAMHKVPSREIRYVWYRACRALHDPVLGGTRLATGAPLSPPIEFDPDDPLFGIKDIELWLQGRDTSDGSYAEDAYNFGIDQQGDTKMGDDEFDDDLSDGDLAAVGNLLTKKKKKTTPRDGKKKKNGRSYISEPMVLDSDEGDNHTDQETPLRNPMIRHPHKPYGDVAVPPTTYTSDPLHPITTASGSWGRRQPTPDYTPVTSNSESVIPVAQVDPDRPTVAKAVSDMVVESPLAAARQQIRADQAQKRKVALSGTESPLEKNTLEPRPHESAPDTMSLPSPDVEKLQAKTAGVSLGPDTSPAANQQQKGDDRIPATRKASTPLSDPPSASEASGSRKRKTGEQSPDVEDKKKTTKKRKTAKAGAGDVDEGNVIPGGRRTKKKGPRS